MISTVSVTMKAFILETAKYLHTQCGYDVTLICNKDDTFAQSLPPYLHYIPVPMARGIDFSAFKSIRAFKKIFKQEKFDFVQYATPNASFYASIAAKAAKIPIRAYCQWGIRYVGFSGFKRKIFKFLEKIVCKNSTHVFAVSPLNRQFAISEKLYDEEKSQVIGNGGTIGVNLEEYDVHKKAEWRAIVRKEYNVSDNDFVFGFAGRISKDKGCGELLEAFQFVHEQCPQAKLLVVGPLEENCGIEQTRIDWAKQSDSVIFTGSVSGEKMREYYAAMDVLVHPTYREGFGMVIQEAGALAVATITTKIPGASEVMENGVSCALVAPKNVEELRDKMLEICADTAKALAYGEAAYTRTVDLYERRGMLENQRKTYTALLGE